MKLLGIMLRDIAVKLLGSMMRDIVVKLLGIMLRDRWWSTTFHTITVRDAVGWC